MLHAASTGRAAGRQRQDRDEDEIDAEENSDEADVVQPTGPDAHGQRTDRSQ